MAVNEETESVQWQKIFSSVELPAPIKQFISQCRIKKIQVSQADNAWEISFECPHEPPVATAEMIKNCWRAYFGDDQEFSLQFEVRKKYDSLSELYSQCWDRVMDKIASQYPSSKGWLGDASFVVNENRLEIVVKNEMAHQYLTSQGLEEIVRRILFHEYSCSVQVRIALEEEIEETNIYQQVEEIEKNYLEIFRERRNGSINQKGDNEDVSSNAEPRIIMGRNFKDSGQSIQEIIEEEKKVVVKGFIFDLEHKPLKTGRSLITFAISDKTDSLAAKIITDGKTSEQLQKSLVPGKWYLFKGSVQIDRFSQELTLMPLDILETYHENREDSCEEKRVELHLHTKMSALDSTAQTQEIIKRAAKWGHKAVAITDHGVVQAFPEAYETASKYGLRIIYGLEGYLFDDKQYGQTPGKVPTYHCIILAVNQEGLRNLYNLVTLSHLQYYYRVPRIPRSELIRLRKGLLIGSACEAGELIRHYLEGVDEDTLLNIANFYDYLEIQPRGNNQFLVRNGTFQGEEDILEMNKVIYEIGQKLSKPVVATGDIHFLDPEDEVYRRILMAGKGFDDADNQAPLYFKTTQEMLDEFAYLGKEAAREVVIVNPQNIVEETEEIKPIPDDFYPPEISGAEDEIMNLAISRAESMYGKPIPDIVRNQIDKELNAIINNGFAVLYLIAHKLVKKSNDDGYLVGSRGSVGSSLVATLTGITEVNPLPPHYRCINSNCKYSQFIDDGSVGSGADLPDKDCPLCGGILAKDGHDIPFEVFLGFEGEKVPDIDLNFSGEYQSKAHKYTEELFGKENVFRAGTIATVASKTAYGFVKNYFDKKGEFIKTAEINRLVSGCTGVKRTTGQHPGGVMVLPRGLDIHRFTPLQRPADDVKTQTITTHFDYHSISSRLVKLDILGHDDPTVLKMLEDLTEKDCKEISLDDPRVLSLFQSTEALGIDPKELGSKLGTLGIPEFGTRFVRQMLEDTKPETFSDLVRISGLSHGTNVWLNNAQELIKDGTAKLSEVISARDDIMVYLIYKGLGPGQAFRIMEGVRKGKGVKEEDIKEMKDHNVPDWYIASCQKIKYMFPKAHAVAYVMMAFRIAYFKVYYPAAYYASFFSVRADEFDADIIVGGINTIKRKMEELHQKGNKATQKEDKIYTILEVALEMYLRGINLQRVDLSTSDSRRFLILDNGKTLLPPLVSLQGLGQAAALGICRAREERPFSSIEDLRIRAKISKTVLEVLQKHGCFSVLPGDDQISLFDLN